MIDLQVSRGLGRCDVPVANWLIAQDCDIGNVDDAVARAELKTTTWNSCFWLSLSGWRCPQYRLSHQTLPFQYLEQAHRLTLGAASLLRSTSTTFGH